MVAYDGSVIPMSFKTDSVATESIMHLNMALKKLKE